MSGNNSLPSFESLPNELLIKIFRFVFVSQADDDDVDEKTAKAVCNRENNTSGSEEASGGINVGLTSFAISRALYDAAVKAFFEVAKLEIGIQGAIHSKAAFAVHVAMPGRYHLIRALVRCSPTYIGVFERNGSFQCSPIFLQNAKEITIKTHPSKIFGVNINCSKAVVLKMFRMMDQCNSLGKVVIDLSYISQGYAMEIDRCVRRQLHAPYHDLNFSPGSGMAKNHEGVWWNRFDAWEYEAQAKYGKSMIVTLSFGRVLYTTFDPVIDGWKDLA